MKAQSQFDTKVHHRDPKTAKVVKVNPYRLVISPNGTVFHRGGKQYYPDGSLKFDPSAAKVQAKVVKAEEAPPVEAPPAPPAPPVEEPKAPEAPVEAPAPEAPESPAEEAKVQAKGKKAK